jgi:peptide/nickel transport system permease protein
MASFLLYLFKRLLIIPATLLVITAVLYAMFLLAPPEERASLYMTSNPPRVQTEEAAQNMIERVIAENGLDDPFLWQYGRWLTKLLRGDWGYSPTFNAPVLELLRLRTPVTLELTFYSLLTLIPLGLISGLLAGWRPHRAWDRQFRGLAFVGSAIPPFILGLFLLSIFYVGMGWFPPGRLDVTQLLLLRSSGFEPYTGFMTIDGLLNGRPEISAEALRHLVLPVITLSLVHWATLGRVTRASTMDETGKEYILAAHARGLRQRSIKWRHVLPIVMIPSLTSIALSAAAIVTGVFVVEIVFNFKGLSELITDGLQGPPDIALVLGFAVYSVFLVIPILLLVDLLKAVVDPRVRGEGGIGEQAE